MAKAIRKMCLVLSLLCCSIAAHGAVDLQSQEKQAICAPHVDVAVAAKASRFAFTRVDAFPCVQALLDTTKVLAPTDGFRAIAPAFIWNAAEVRSGLPAADPLAKQIDAMLATIASDDAHPLQGHAWLAQGLITPRTITSGRDIQVAYTKLGMIPLAQFKGPIQAETWMASIHPLFLDQMRELFAQIADYDAKVVEVGVRNQVLGKLAFMPSFFAPAVVERMMQKRLETTTLVPPAQPPSVGSADPTDMSFKVTGYVEAGRGGRADLSPVTTTSVYNLQHVRDWVDGNGGDHSRAYFVVNILETHREPQTGLVGYGGAVRYYAQGGYRNRSVGVSAEDQTSVVEATVVGTAIIPKCTDLKKCKPSLLAVLQEGTIHATVTLAQTSGTQTMTPGKQIVLDTTQSDTTITATLTHSVRHVGACCAAPESWASFRLNFAPTLPLIPAIPAGAPPPPPPPPPPAGITPEDLSLHDEMVPYSSATKILEYLFSRADGVIPYVPYAEILTDIKFNTADLSHRYAGVYLRLLMIDYLLTQGSLDAFSPKQNKVVPLPLSAEEISAIKLARAALGSIARAEYSAYVKSTLKSKQDLLQRLNTQSLDQAIAALSKGQTIDTKKLDAYTALLLKDANATQRIGILQKELAAFYDARAKDNILDAVISLLEFRRGYVDLIRSTQRDIKSLVKEAVQLQ